MTIIPDFFIDIISHLQYLIQWINPEYYEEIEGMSYDMEVDMGVMVFL